MYPLVFFYYSFFSLVNTTVPCRMCSQRKKNLMRKKGLSLLKKNKNEKKEEVFSCSFLFWYMHLNDIYLWSIDIVDLTLKSFFHFKLLVEILCHINTHNFSMAHVAFSIKQQIEYMRLNWQTTIAIEWKWRKERKKATT